MITKMNVLDIMNESVKTSAVNTDNHIIDEIAESVESQIKSLDEMNISLTFTPEMVPVVYDEASENYFVEYDMLAKLRECGDCISVDTKYGKICFEPKTDDTKLCEPGDEAITEEEPEEVNEPKESDDDDKETNEIDESYLMNPLYCTPSNSYGICWERDALNQVILANMARDPNREEIDKKDCCEIPEMTMENTYVVIESEDDLCGRIDEIMESAKSGGVALKNGKAQLIKADEAFKNMINHGLKVVKRKKTVTESGDARQKYIELQDRKSKDKRLSDEERAKASDNKANYSAHGSLRGTTRGGGYDSSDNYNDRKKKEQFKKDFGGPDASSIHKKINAKSDKK